MSLDPKAQLQTEYYNLLNGNISAPVYDFVPEDAEYPHVVIGQYTIVDDSDKSSFGQDLTVELQTVDRFPNSGGSRVNGIFPLTEEVKEIIRVMDANSTFTLADFRVHTAVVDQQNTFEELTETYKYVREVIRFRHLIEQKQ